MPEKEQFIPPGAVEDVEKAEEAAYAEKPYRDALAKYRGELNDEQRKSFDWVASQEGESAMNAYDETKAREARDEDEKVVKLREAVGSLLNIKDRFRFRPENRKDLMERYDLTKDDIQAVVNKISGKRIEDILSNRAWKAKDKRVALLNYTERLTSGVSNATRELEQDMYIPEEMSGYLAGLIGMSEHSSVQKFIERMGKERSVSSQEVLNDFLPYITKQRSVDSTQWDKLMKRVGFKFDSKSQGYVSIKEEK